MVLFLCELLVNVNLPESITLIGDRAFSRCKSLNNPNLLPALISISDSAFDDCIQFVNSENERIHFLRNNSINYLNHPSHPSMWSIKLQQILEVKDNAVKISKKTSSLRQCGTLTKRSLNQHAKRIRSRTPYQRTRMD